jgi:hypothetical protein
MPTGRQVTDERFKFGPGRHRRRLTINPNTNDDLDRELRIYD